MMKIHHSLFAFLLFFCCSGYAQNITVAASADKNVIFIGEQIKLQLEAVIPRDEVVNWPVIDSINHFEVLSASKLDSQLSGNDLVLKQTLIITSWDSGRWQIPPFVIVPPHRTKPINIDVTYSPFDRDQPYHDIKDILEAGKRSKITWYWYLIGAVLLLLLFLLLFPGKKKKAEATEFVPDEGIYKQSLNRLEALRGKVDDDPKVLHTELVDIFRDYLYKRKGIQSFSKTTDDLGVQIGHLQLSNTVYGPMLQTLRMSDLVKFARFQPTGEENRTSIDIIKQSIIAIENTK